MKIRDILKEQGVAEGFLGEADASAVQFRTASTDNYQSSFTVTAIADGKNVGHFSFFRDPETDDVHNQAEVTDDVRGKGYGKALLLKAIEVANDHGLGFQEDSQSLSRAQSRVYDSLYDAGWIVDTDGYWFLTPEGEQELARLSTIQQGVAEGTLNEYRNALYDFVKSKFPGWPEYVLRDFLYAQAKGIRDQQELKDFLERNQKDFGQVKWRLEKLPITLDIFTVKTQRMIRQREGGSSNPFQVPRDAERHALQQRMIQQKGVSPEPIIVAKLSNGYDLIEGWHRTIQHLQAYPEGYTASAWVGYGATYTSESMAENFADGKVKGRSRPGRFKRAGVSCKGSVADLRRKAKNSTGERQKGFHWCANMKSGRKKASE